jgi:AraC-like DNA-binding protein
LGLGYEVVRPVPRYHVVLATIAGSATVELGEMELRIEAGDMLLLPAGVAHRYRALACGWSMAWLHLSNRGRWKRHGIQRVPVRLSGRAHSLASTFSVCIEEASQGNSKGAEAAAELAAVLVESAFGEAPTKGDRWDSVMRGVLRALEERLDRSWSVEEMARMARTSTPHFHRLAALHWGAPPMRQLTKLRLERALALLKHTDLAVYQVAEAVGYSDAFAFSTAFRRHHGVAPSALRTGR